MPEGDTVWRVTQRLNTVLAGEPLGVVDLRWPNLPEVDLVGRATIEVVPRAKHLLHRVEGGWTLHTHLGMEGMWRLWRPSDMTTAHWHHREVRAAVGTANWLCLGYRLRLVQLLRTSDEPSVIGHLGPDVLGADWDPARAVTALSAHPDTIGAALLDQRPMSGVGTFWAAEALFAHRLYPWTPASEVDPEVLRAMVDWLHTTMQRSTQHPAPSVTGSQRREARNHVHARSGLACRRCGTIVRVEQVGPPTRRRPMFYCPSCQGGLAPSDQGRRLGPLGSRGR